MPLQKVEKLFAEIEQADVTSALGRIGAALKSSTRPVHEILSSHLPDLGTQTPAAYAIARSLIMRNGSTQEDEVLAELQLFIRHTHRTVSSVCQKAEDPSHDRRDMHIFFERMIDKSDLTRLPSGVIIFKA